MLQNRTSRAWLSVVVLFVVLCTAISACGTTAAPAATQPPAESGKLDFSGRTLVIQTWGGQVAEAEKAAFYAPFEAETGAKIQLVAATGEIGAQLKSQVGAGNTEWDMVSGHGGASLATWAGEGLLEQIDPAKIPGLKYLTEGSYFDYGVATEIDAIVATYSTAEGVKPLTSLRDFFDVENYPGPRVAPNWGTADIQMMVALLADGVPPDKLFPLDIDRALKVWDRVKPSVEVWFQSGNQMVQALVDDQVVYGFCWDGRVMQAMKINPKWTFIYEGGESHASYYGIVKGTKNLDMALAFLDFTTDPQRQAIFVMNIGYSSSNPKLQNYLPDSLKPYLSTTPENRAKLFVLKPEQEQLLSAQNAECEEAWAEWLSK
jgi:putative spermidine/putrescine transport system substrate-binding protein